MLFLTHILNAIKSTKIHWKSGKYWAGKIIRIQCFLLFLLCVFVFLQERFTDFSEPQRRWNNIYSDVDYDVLFMGSSHSYCTFNPEWFKDSLVGLNSFNLSSSRQNIVQTYYNLREVLKYQKPKYIILEIHSLFIVEDPNKVGFIYENLDGMRFSWEKVQSIYHTVSPQYYVDALLPLVRQHADWKKPRNWFTNINKDRTMPAQHGGFRVVKDKVISEKKYKRALKKRKKKNGRVNVSQKHKDYFHEFVMLCRQHDIKLVLVKTPTLKQHYLNTKVNQFLNFYAYKYQVPLYNLNYEFEQLKLGRSDFLDEGHMSYKGAEKICRYLGKKLLHDGVVQLYQHHRHSSDSTKKQPSKDKE